MYAFAAFCFTLPGLAGAVRAAWLSGAGIACIPALAAAALLCFLGRRAEITNALLVGSALYLIGALCAQPVAAGVLLTCGTALCLCALCRLSGVMKDAAAFIAPESHSHLPRLALGWLLPAALGCGLVWAVPQAAKPLGVASAAALLLCALNLPVDKRYTHKLRRYLDGRQDNEPLRKRLAWVFIEKHRRPWLILFIEWFLRLTYRYRRVHEEEIREDEDNPLIYLCNHGDLYGPVACILHIPNYVRPWVISYIMADLQETAEYLHRYNFGPAKWLPGPLKWPVSFLVGRISHWAMNISLEAVPVYRDKPRQLINTFRATVDVLKSGDQLLIFPENPNAVAQDHGYESSGVGELFSGFAMLAPIYYSRTGKRCRFMPMYANQAKRTLSFGHEVCFDPDNDPTEERSRLVSVISAEMNRLYQESQSL